MMAALALPGVIARNAPPAKDRGRELVEDVCTPTATNSIGCAGSYSAGKSGGV